MAKKVIWTPEAKRTFNTVLDYLDVYWSEKEKIAFVRAVARVVNLISKQPLMFRRVAKLNVREVLVTKHNLLLYRIKEKEIDLLIFWDTRQHPKKKRNKFKRLSR